ncbi:helix-turn-helix domain-containing protein [Bacteroides uniformis]|jgi:hypothetical protein|uniref:DNA-binding protein n=1 Tax=Bacteroides uniformis TaxID=820 RepID=A0A3E4R1N8_BACUN|nr:helix-turn-helix domain-containing protein [Bacteroides uniformis]RGL13348.1 DNA-binding protein [Bacteroides uniformis]DAE79962.1 MAG TPA: Protein of unknown function (DUF3853) [Caudoviricetes sp.]DAE79989.1 MAG TPA: Protein of unknown function (DUF3853) [Caudoviricetes sp.]
MRNKQEINQCAAILRKKGDRVSLLQAEILENGRNESWVFTTYVASVPEADKDETVFYACRDAARFAAGRLSLEELIPDADKYPVVLEKPKVKQERQTVSVQEFEALKRKVKQLEGFVEDLLKERRQRAEYQKLPDTNRADFIGQKEATDLVGCSRETLNSWQRKGLITGYRKAGLVYYSKSELAANPVVQNFISIKDRRRK